MDENRNSLISIKHLSITITWGGGWNTPEYTVLWFLSCFLFPAFLGWGCGTWKKRLPISCQHSCILRDNFFLNEAQYTTYIRYSKPFNVAKTEHFREGGGFYYKALERSERWQDYRTECRASELSTGQRQNG